MTRDAAVGRRENVRLLALSLGVVAGTFLIRSPFLHVPLITDEGAYAYVARFWSRGAALYRDLPLDRPQGLFLIYRAALALGDGVETIRLVAAAWQALTAIALAALARDLFGWRSAAWAAVSYVVFSTAPAIEGFTANAEGFTLLPLVLSAHAAWRERWGASGLLAGLAMVIKPSGISGIVFALAWAFVAARAVVPAVVRVIAGGSAPVVGSLAHGAWVGWHDYVDAFIGRRLRLYSVLSSPPAEQLEKLLAGLTATAPAWVAPAVACAGAVAARGTATREMRFVMLWFATAWTGMALGGEWHLHYFQQVVPMLVVGGSALAGSGLQGARRWAWVTAVVLAMGVFASRQGGFWARAPDEISARLYDRPGYLVQREVASAIRARTAPSARIQVATYEAELYFLADRRAAVEQYFLRELFDIALRQRLLDALLRGEPELVVLLQPLPGMTLLQTHQLLMRRYDRTADVRGVGIYERRPGLTAPQGGATGTRSRPDGPWDP